jgi:hypothetical protein
VMVDAELYDGGSTSFTLVFLVVTSKACSPRRRTDSVSGSSMDK